MDILITHTGGPAFSTLNTVGQLGVNVGLNTGLDIDPAGNAYMVANNSLYTINLNTGTATLAGSFLGGARGVIGPESLAVVPEPAGAVLALVAGLAFLTSRRRPG